MLSKISVIQKKILVGGENLLEKAKQQQFLLQVSGAELESLEESRQQLEETLYKKGVLIVLLYNTKIITIHFKGGTN